MSLLQPFLENVERAPDRDAIVPGVGPSVTYSELSRRSSALAMAYRDQGIGSGDRVLVIHPVSPTLYATLIALWRLGAVAVFPEPSAGLRGVQHAIRVSQPRAIAAPPWLRLVKPFLRGVRWIELLRPARTPAEFMTGDTVEVLDNDHPALISFTSGSTEQPKGIVRSHGLLLAQQAEIERLLPADDFGCNDLVWFPAMVLSSLAIGRGAVLPEAPLRRPSRVDSAKLARQAADHNVSRLFLPPIVCARLAGTAFPNHVKHVFTGGGPLFPHLIELLEGQFPNTTLHLVYGATEAEPIAVVASDDISEADRDAMRGGAGLVAGHPVPGADVVLEDDEILVAGDHVVSSYLDPVNEAAARATVNGRRYHRTGDAGWLDGSGRIWLLGRKAQSAGEHHPFAIESAAYCWTGVRQAAFFNLDGKARLAISGDDCFQHEWRTNAERLGVRVDLLSDIPMDRRHESKVDYRALRRRLGGHGKKN